MNPLLRADLNVWSDGGHGPDTLRPGEAAGARAATSSGQEDAVGQRRARLSREPWTWISHEMRTPLNAILGYVHLLQSEPMTARHAEGLAIIRKSSEHLLALTTNILDLASNAAGALRLRPRPTALVALLQGVCDIGGVLARQKALAFDCEMAPDLPTVIIVDDLRLRQVLLNLVGNAIKFTPSGHVALRVGTVSIEDRQAPETSGPALTVRLCFEVEDSGVGLSESELQRLFRPFEAIAEVFSPEGGTGLGLAVTRQLVSLMGGEIEVRSTPSEGSRFTFQLDLPVVQDGVAAAPSSRRSLEAADSPQWTFESVSGECAALPPDEVELLHWLARRGDMRAIRERAEYLRGLNAECRPFAERLDALAREYQTRAITALIERVRTNSNSTKAPPQ
jgi:nitrogen-specific signal transduction histidine kinase